MTDDEVRRYDTAVKISAFAAENDSFFPAASVQAEQITAIDTDLAYIDGEGGKQAGGLADARQQYEIKDTARENLREDVSDIASTARSMQYEFDGIEELFRMVRGSRDADLVNTARAFHTESLPYNADFIRYGLPATFRADLQAKIDAFEATLPATAGAIGEHVEATNNIGSAIRRMMTARRILLGVMKNVLAGDPGKYAAWLSASHLEKASASPPTP